MTVDQNNTEALRQQLDAAQSSEDQVRIVAEFVLRRLGADSDARRKTSSEVVDYAFGSLGLEMPVARNTFVNYLSTVARSAHSAIVVAGRGRGGGYFLSSGALDMVEKAQVRPEESSRTYTRTEEALYPIFQRWLMAQGYRAKTTASMRSLGKWSNPDVTGIRVNEHFGRIDIDIVTIEAKKDLFDWERVFFEAVSHRRYATRAYFAFPIPESGQSKLPEEMRYYSELYNVGVLAFLMTEADYAAYQASGVLPDVTDVNDVVEVWSARSSVVPMSQQRTFCEALEIRDIQGLMQFGND